MKKTTFGLFADLHYKKGMYSATVVDLEAVLERAKNADADFVLHCGDMCNDYVGSPELINTYLNNRYGLSVYGVYGNHELESENNSMQAVTPLLTNDKNAVWGTADGKIGDGQTAYYYIDKGDLRIICTDTNYSFNPSNGEWEHNLTCSYGPPSGNIFSNSLGPKQFEWLEKLLIASAREEKHCVIIGHATYCKKFRGATPDADAVNNLFARVNAMRSGTVIMAINGHYHTNHLIEDNGVVYFDMNTTRNIWWQGKSEPHYNEEHTYKCETVDENGNITGTQRKPFCDLWMSANTWFSDKPLSAVITVSDEGIEINGMEADWAYGIRPTELFDGSEPKVSSGQFKATFNCD